MTGDQLERYRAAVADDQTGPDLERAINEIRRGSIEVHGHDSLKTVPRGYPREHPRAALLQHKGITAWREWPAAPWLATASAKKRIFEFLRATRPLQDWLTTYVGPSSSDGQQSERRTAR